MAQTATNAQVVTLRGGAGSTQLNGQIKGAEGVSYKIWVGAGQTLTVDFNGSRNADITVEAPSRIVLGSGGPRYRISGLLPSDGYVLVDIRHQSFDGGVWDTPNSPSSYSLRIVLSGVPLTPVAESRKERPPHTSLHAAAHVPCTLGSTGKATTCKAVMVRRVNNSVTLVLANPEGSERQFLFVGGRLVASDVGWAWDSDRKVSIQRRDGTSVLTLGVFYEGPDGYKFERYWIDDSLLVGT